GLSKKHHSLLFEGAGGWLVPITETETLADFAVRLNLPVIVVVANRLGCLNHTLLTLESLRARNLHCPGIILNHLTPDADIAQRTNAEVLARHTTILLEIPPACPAISPADTDRFLRLIKK
ncbi:MAG: ATP-dependent dethiobiotin synthetase BioD, partial [Verrucomicrobiota bacterium]